jgi:hypothetical protein
VDEKHTYGPIKHGASPLMRRADLEFYGINHFRPSYVARIFFNDPEVDVDNAADDRPSYAGRFAIFGHQTCTGGEGHCEVHPHARRFDDRPSHPLTRAFKRVVVTDAVRRCLSEGEDLTITVIATSDPKAPMEYEGNLLEFQGMQLATFE